MYKKDLGEATILSIPVFGKPKYELLKTIKNRLQNSSKEDILTIFTPNAEQVMLAHRDDIFRSALMSTSVRIPDGMSLVLASRLLSLDRDDSPLIHERISGIDLIGDLVELAVHTKSSIYMLGGQGSTAAKAALLQKEKYAGENSNRKLKIIGTSGHANIRNYIKRENEAILKMIADFHADILLVGYGAPWQELWVVAHKKRLQEMGVKVVMVVGGAFDMLSGNLKRAPGWMRAFGLEWLWRLVQEPWRWRRQLSLFRFWGLVGRELLR